MREVTWSWSAPQSEALLSEAPYLDLEGGIRSGKTTVANAKVQIRVSRMPGANLLLSRWSDKDLQAELVPKWRAFAQQCGMELAWNPSEQCDEILHTAGVFEGLARGNARVYLRGLRSSDATSRYGAIRGLDLSFIHVEQAEEVPADYFPELAGRLSQRGYPHQLMLTPQPVNNDHWIAAMFPESNLDPAYHYIRTNCYDNRANLPEGYIEKLEQTYPVGSASRRTLLEGRRGLAIQGEPVYAGYFNRRLHESAAVALDPFTPLLEGWDFGQGHPCVSWWQLLSIGRLQCLGAVMGHNLYLEDFAPIALTYRNRWCPNPAEVWSVGDPAGLDISNQGTETTKVRDILAAHGVTPISQAHANRPEIRFQSTQTVASFMRRMALDGQPAFQVHPRAIEVNAKGLARPAAFHLDGFEAGYVWDTRQVIGVGANIRRPKKDGYYDHFQNTSEYVVLAYAPGAQPTQADVQKAERAAQRRAQVDYDEDAPRRGRGGRRTYIGGQSGRGGY